MSCHPKAPSPLRLPAQSKNVMRVAIGLKFFSGWDDGLICGGSVTGLILPFERRSRLTTKASSAQRIVQLPYQQPQRLGSSV